MSLKGIGGHYFHVLPELPVVDYQTQGVEGEGIICCAMGDVGRVLLPNVGSEKHQTPGLPMEKQPIVHLLERILGPDQPGWHLPILTELDTVAGQDGERAEILGYPRKISTVGGKVSLGDEESGKDSEMVGLWIIGGGAYRSFLLEGHKKTKLVHKAPLVPYC